MNSGQINKPSRLSSLPIQCHRHSNSKMQAKTIFLVLFLQSFAVAIDCATPAKNNDGPRAADGGGGYNILALFHMPCRSHHILGSTLLKELARRGHQVTMVSPFPFAEKIPNYTDIELKDMMSFKDEFMQPFMKADTYTYKNVLKNLFFMMPTLGDAIYGQASVQELLRSDSKFDAIVVFNPWSELLFPLSHRFEAPIILFSPIGSTYALNALTGNLSPYSYVPHLFSPYSDKMTFCERVKNALLGLGVELVSQALHKRQQERVIRKYFPDGPPLDELYDNVALALVNSHFSTESPRPYTPNMIQIGGFHVESVDPLPKDLQKYLDESTDGVVYFNFGTNVNIAELPADKLKVIWNCFAKRKQKVLVKYDGDRRALPKNVRGEKWLPQKSILAHPNVKAFITHGGKGSVIEATKAAVPMLAVPFFGDQAQNVAEAVDGKYAISLLINEITETGFEKALDDILNDPVYKENIRKKSLLLSAQPMSPMDVAVYWIEHVVKFKGADHLKPASLRMNVFQLLALDVFAFLFGAVITAIVSLYLVLKGVCKLCKCRGSAKKNAKSKVKKS